MAADAQLFAGFGTSVRSRGRSGRSAFTLAEVLAALLFMAILVPVAMHGVSVASRAGTLSQRKAIAMRIAERVLEEQIAQGQIGTAVPYGSIVENDLTYPWTLKSDAWAEDDAISLNVLTVRVEFTVQGTTYDVAASTLYDPLATTTVTTSTSTASTSAL